MTGLRRLPSVGGRTDGHAAVRRHDAASVWLVAVVWAVSGALAAPLIGQSITVHLNGDAVHVRAPGFTFLERDVLTRLRDGQSVHLELELTVMDRPDGPAVASAKEGFNLSFDVWEERFAVTRIGKPVRSRSHLTDRAAEAWCLEQVTIARTDLRGLAAETPFWIRIVSRVAEEISVADSEAAEAFTLRRLIDMLSRRDHANTTGRIAEAGPFRLSN